MIFSESVRRARWVEAETVHLKKMGLSFDAIADQITRVGRGEAVPMIATPQPISFPTNYLITRQACHKAFRKAIAREPALEVEEFRKLDTDRCEDLYFTLQPAIRKGNFRAVEAGVKVLSHKAKINGYNAPQRHELTGKDGRPLTALQLLSAIGPLPEQEEE